MMTNQNSSPNNLAEHGQSSLPPEQMKLHIGDSIQLQIGNKCHFATLIGYLKGQSVIVTMPDEKGAPIQPAAGEPLVARFFIDQRAYAFDTVVHHAANEPFPHLHLAYPEETRALKERQYDRVRINIAGSADISDGTSFSCTVRDISIGGALIALRNQTGVVNDPLLLTLRIAVNGIDYELRLGSEIRSVRVGNSSNDSESLILQGLAFHDLSRQDILALAAFDLLPDWNTAP